VRTEKDKKKAIEWLRSNGKHLKVERCGNSYVVKSIKRQMQVMWFHNTLLLMAILKRVWGIILNKQARLGKSRGLSRTISYHH